jgi:hypothetical protein
LYTTTNGGTSWTSQAMPFHASDIFFSDMSNGFACGTANNSSAVMMKTTNGGQSWSPVFSETDPNLFVNNFMKQDILSSGAIYTSLESTNKLYKSLDGGATWDTIVVDSVYAIQDFQFTSALVGHVLSSQGQIFVTNDGGQTWALEYATAWGFYGPSIYFFSFSFVEEIGYVGGTSGLIKKHDATASLEEHSNTNGLNIYPNPLNNSQDLVIEATEMNGDVKVQIVNAVGQIVFSKTISQTQNNNLTISGLNLPAGVYSVSVEMNEMKNTKKLMIVD